MGTAPAFHNAGVHNEVQVSDKGWRESFSIGAAIHRRRCGDVAIDAAVEPLLRLLEETE